LTTASGVLPNPPRNDVLVSGTEDLIGIASTGASPKMGGDRVSLTLLQARKVKHAATVPSGVDPFWLATVAGVAQSFNFAHPHARLALRYRTDSGIAPSPCWQLEGVTQ
jgi:hypothetical protein